MAKDSFMRHELVVRAVSNLEPRADREPNPIEIEKTYVDTGVLAKLDNTHNQIVYGRRGTGKSHMLKMLGLRLAGDVRSESLYVDVRLLGSAQMMTQIDQPLSRRSVSVFRDLMSQIQSRLSRVATDEAHGGIGIDEVGRLEESLRRRNVQVDERQTNQKTSTKQGDGFKAGINLGPKPSATMDWQASSERNNDDEAHQTEKLEETVVFAEVAACLRDCLHALNIERFYLFIDEWAQSPPDIQPYVADFIKRTMLPISEITIKICSLEYRSKFRVTTDEGYTTGFELGSDIQANVDLDEFYVYDRAKDFVVGVFRQVLKAHLLADLDATFLKEQGIRNDQTFTRALFTEEATFTELVRAGEGVVRDFFGVFTIAHGRALRDGNSKIDLRSVEEAARTWYESDKAKDLPDIDKGVLQRIIDEVIGAKRARMFMLKREHADARRILSLFDLRLIHLIESGYADKENPGRRYNIYTLDYGAYVDLKRTKAEPDNPGLFDDVLDEIDVENVQTVPMPFVPSTDKRSIRRVILSPEILGIGQ